MGYKLFKFEYQCKVQDCNGAGLYEGDVFIAHIVQPIGPDQLEITLLHIHPLTLPTRNIRHMGEKNKLVFRWQGNALGSFIDLPITNCECPVINENDLLEYARLVIADTFLVIAEYVNFERY